MAGTIRETILNGVAFRYEYRLYNNVSSVRFNDSAVISLVLDDDFFCPFMSGCIILANNFNYIENDFVLRGDGTDKLYIYLEHEIDDGGGKKVKKIIEQTFTVVEEFNFIDDSTQIKNRKMYKFIHEDESLMRELFPYEKRYYGSAGNILKEILGRDLNFLVDDKVFPAGNLVIDSFPEMIIPTTPFRYLDIIFYLLKYYYVAGSGGLPEKGFLKRNSHTNKYELITLSKDIFERHNELVYEAFHSGDLATDYRVNPNNPPSEGALTRAYINNVVSTNVTVPGTSVSNTYYMNALVTGYDHMYGSSRIRKIMVRDIRDKWAEKFVDVFKTVGGKPKKHINLSDIKIGNGYKTVRLPFTFEDSINITIADMVTNFTFFNQQMNINVLGDLGREPGTFIDVYKTKNDPNHRGDEITLGRWLVTGVKHMKINNTFRNQIFCAKTYAGPEFKDYISSRKR